MRGMATRMLMVKKNNSPKMEMKWKSGSTFQWTCVQTLSSYMAAGLHTVLRAAARVYTNYLLSLNQCSVFRVKQCRCCKFHSWPLPPLPPLKASLTHTPLCHHGWLKPSVWLPQPSLSSLAGTFPWFPSGVSCRGQCSALCNDFLAPINFMYVAPQETRIFSCKTGQMRYCRIMPAPFL